VSSQDCKKVTFVGLESKKALIHHSYKTIPTDQNNFCKNLCYMDNRCISCTYDIQMKLCNLSNTNDVMHPESLVEVPNVEYVKIEVLKNTYLVEIVCS